MWKLRSITVEKVTLPISSKELKVYEKTTNYIHRTFAVCDLVKHLSAGAKQLSDNRIYHFGICGTYLRCGIAVYEG